MTTKPQAIMASEFELLDGVPEKKRGMGAIICLTDRKLGSITVILFVR